MQFEVWYNQAQLVQVHGAFTIAMKDGVRFCTRVPVQMMERLQTALLRHVQWHAHVRSVLLATKPQFTIKSQMKSSNIRTNVGARVHRCAGVMTRTTWDYRRGRGGGPWWDANRTQVVLRLRVTGNLTVVDANDAVGRVGKL